MAPLAAIALVATVATTVSSIAVQASAAGKAKEQARKLAHEQRVEAIRQSSNRREDAVREILQTRGRAQAGFAKAGVDVLGTPLEVLGSLEQAGLETLGRIQQGFDVDLRNIGARERATITDIDGQTTGAIIGGTASILSTGATLGTELHAQGVFSRGAKKPSGVFVGGSVG